MKKIGFVMAAFLWGILLPFFVQAEGTSLPEGQEPTFENQGNACPSVEDMNAMSPEAQAKLGYCIQLKESLGEFKSIRGNSGWELTTNYLQVLYKYGVSIIGIICVLVIVVSGIQMTAGGASSEMVTQAKDRIWGAILSLVLLFLTAMILRSVNPGFFL